MVEDRLYAVAPEVVHGLGTELVNLQTASCHRIHGMGGLPCGGMSEAQDGPASLRHFPCEAALCVHLAGQSHDVGLAHDGLGREYVFPGRLFVGILEGTQALELEILDAEVARWGGEGQHDDVLVIVAVGLGAGQRHRLLRAVAHQRGVGPHDCLHALCRRDPATAARRPAGPVVHTQGHAQPFGLSGGPLDQVEPFGREVLGSACRIAIPHIENLRLANACLVHGLQVGRNAMARHIAVEPMPPCAGVTYHILTVPAVQAVGHS